MEPTACTLNLTLHLSVTASHLCKQTIYKIQRKFHISRAGVMSVLFLFSLHKEIPNLSHSELMRFQEEKR